MVKTESTYPPSIGVQLSIIVPVYNVEPYIRSCVESIFSQGLDECLYELILVNDGTQDDSFGKINDILSSHQNIRVINQDNLGLSAARNTGMKHSTGRYILFLDSDDLLVANSLCAILEHVTESQVDMLIAGFVKVPDEEMNNKPRYFVEDVFEAKLGRDIFLNEFNPSQCYVWRSIYRKNFLTDNNISFIPGIYFEDVPFTIECYLKAGLCIKTNSVFYIYRQRSNSIVSSINERKLLDMNIVIEHLWSMRRNLCISAELDRTLMKAIFATFSLVIWYLTHVEELLRYKENILCDLKSRVPDLFFTGGGKQIVVSIAFKYIPFIYVDVLAFVSRCFKRYS